MNNGNMVVLPNIEMAYNLLADKMALFLGINGNIEKQNFRLLANENPFLANNISLRNTKNTEIFAGLKGETGPLSFSIDASHRSLDHLAMYVTNGDSLPKFKVLYDTAKIISFGGEFNYQIKDNINVSAAIKQRIYKLNNEMKAWHLPSFTAVFGLGYTKNKLNINMDMNIENGVPYLASEGPLTLDPLLALNLGVRYRITKQIEAFIQLNNLLNNKRQRWQYYENIGINFLGGIQMRF
jgi:outer membrane receptor protein involved in Fe transport